MSKNFYFFIDFSWTFQAQSVDLKMWSWKKSVLHTFLWFLDDYRIFWRKFYGTRSFFKVFIFLALKVKFAADLYEWGFLRNIFLNRGQKLKKKFQRAHLWDPAYFLSWTFLNTGKIMNTRFAMTYFVSQISHEF